MRFTWDSEKNLANIRRHAISLADAARIFEGATVERVDDRFEYGETRVYAIGLVNGIEITVIYTDHEDDERRIISAWRAEPHERRYYWQHAEGRDQDRLATPARDLRRRNPPSGRRRPRR